MPLESSPSTCSTGVATTCLGSKLLEHRRFRRSLGVPKSGCELTTESVVSNSKASSWFGNVWKSLEPYGILRLSYWEYLWFPWNFTTFPIHIGNWEWKFIIPTDFHSLHDFFSDLHHGGSHISKMDPIPSKCPFVTVTLCNRNRLVNQPMKIPTLVLIKSLNLHF